MGKKLAVLVGCNYPSTQIELHRCVKDVAAMRLLLLESYGFDNSHVDLLTDAPWSFNLPTGENIKAALKRMVDKAEAEDVLFFHFSGHGTKISSLEPGHPFRQHEAIVPCDLNVITDMDLMELIRPLPKGVSFTILSDSCHSGGLIDKYKEQIGPVSVEKLMPSVNHRPKGFVTGLLFNLLGTLPNLLLRRSLPYPAYSPFGPSDTKAKNPHQSLDENEGILITGCQANETPVDGAFTNAVLQVLVQNSVGTLSNKQVVMMAREVLKENGFGQNACLYCSDGNADAPFLGHPVHKHYPY
ncbi:hypothetical protein PTKIN_Ptkin16aG0056600 [Pterospermum kingtungense]